MENVSGLIWEVSYLINGLNVCHCSSIDSCHERRSASQCPLKPPPLMGVPSDQGHRSGGCGWSVDSQGWMDAYLFGDCTNAASIYLRGQSWEWCHTWVVNIPVTRWEKRWPHLGKPFFILCHDTLNLMQCVCYWLLLFSVLWAWQWFGINNMLF